MASFSPESPKAKLWAKISPHFNILKFLGQLWPVLSDCGRFRPIFSNKNEPKPDATYNIKIPKSAKKCQNFEI